MKTTIEIPEDLYRRVKAKSALEGKAVREVTVELYRRWLGETEPVATTETPEDWVRSWLALADEYMKDAPPGPSAREVLEEDRRRLEHR